VLLDIIMCIAMTVSALCMLAASKHCAHSLCAACRQQYSYQLLQGNSALAPTPGFGGQSLLASSAQSLDDPVTVLINVSAPGLAPGSFQPVSMAVQSV
jgi:hypothetical protein